MCGLIAGLAGSARARRLGRSCGYALEDLIGQRYEDRPHQRCVPRGQTHLIGKFLGWVDVVAVVAEDRTHVLRDLSNPLQFTGHEDVVVERPIAKFQGLARPDVACGRSADWC